MLVRKLPPMPHARERYARAPYEIHLRMSAWHRYCARYDISSWSAFVERFEQPGRATLHRVVHRGEKCGTAVVIALLTAFPSATFEELFEIERVSAKELPIEDVA